MKTGPERRRKNAGRKTFLEAGGGGQEAGHGHLPLSMPRPERSHEVEQDDDGASKEGSSCLLREQRLLWYVGTL